MAVGKVMLEISQKPLLVDKVWRFVKARSYDVRNALSEIKARQNRFARKDRHCFGRWSFCRKKCDMCVLARTVFKTPMKMRIYENRETRFNFKISVCFERNVSMNSWRQKTL